MTKIKLPNGTFITMEDFLKSFPTEKVTDEINKEILKELNKNKNK